MGDSRKHNSAGFPQGTPHCSVPRAVQGPLQWVFAQVFSASQTTTSRKAANREQSQQPDVTTAETSELPFTNQPDKFFVKPKQELCFQKTVPDRLCSANLQEPRSFKNFPEGCFCQFQHHDKSLYYPWTSALQTAWLPHHMLLRAWTKARQV